MKSVVFEGQNLKYIGKKAFSGTMISDLEIPESVNFIDDSSFSGCRKLENVRVRGSLDYFGKDVFRGCIKLESVIFDGHLNEIPERTFINSESLKSVGIEKAEKIGAFALLQRTVSGEL